MRTNTVLDSFFCTVIFLTAVVKSFPQDIADSDADLKLPQGRSEESFVGSQAEFNPPVLPSVPFWTEKTPDTEGSTDEDLITAFNVGQSIPVSSSNEVMNAQAAQPVDCSSLNPSEAAKIKRATSCVIEPEQPPVPKMPNKPILNPNKKVILDVCPPNTFAFCCDAALYDLNTRSYGDCHNCLCPRIHNPTHQELTLTIEIQIKKESFASIRRVGAQESQE